MSVDAKRVYISLNLCGLNFDIVDNTFALDTLLVLPIVDFVPTFIRVVLVVVGFTKG
jgi:hypothetical protein